MAVPRAREATVNWHLRGFPGHTSGLGCTDEAGFWCFLSWSDFMLMVDWCQTLLLGGCWCCLHYIACAEGTFGTWHNRRGQMGPIFSGRVGWRFSG